MEQGAVESKGFFSVSVRNVNEDVILTNSLLESNRILTVW